MTKSNTVSSIALSLALAVGIAGGATFVTPAAVMAGEAAKAPTVAPAVGKPLQEATALMKANNFKEAAVKAQAAAAAAKTPYEIYVSNEILGAAYVKAGDYANLLKAFEASYNSGYMQPAEKTARVKVLAQVYGQVKNYPKAIEYANMYLKENPADTDIPVTLAQIYYTQQDYKKAAEAIRGAVRTADAAGKATKEDTLVLLMSSEYQQKNDPGTISALEMLYTRYPKQQYIKDLITTVDRGLRADNPTTKTSLDVQVIKFSYGLFDSAQDYTQATELALQDGLPGLAKKIMDKGVAAGVIGVGAAKDREQRMINMANTQAASDQKGLAAGEAEAAKAKTGDALVKYSEAYWSYDMGDKAIATAQAGIDKGATNPDDAKLRLGIAQIGAGKKAEAVATFKGITPNTTAAKLAGLWRLQK